MLPQSIPRVQTTDRIVNQLQQNIIPVLQLVSNNPLLSNNFVTSLSLTPGSNTVPHGLARPLIGWFCTRVRAAATVYDQQDTNPNPSTTLILVASAAVVIDLVVF